MPSRSFPRRIPSSGLLAAFVFFAATAATAAVPASTKPGDAAAPHLLSSVPADLSAEAFDAHLGGHVLVHALVSAVGLVDEARATSGDARLCAAAEAAVRWYVFEASAKGAALDVDVDVAKAAADEDPLSPDLIAEARSAEKEGDRRTALDWWVGALNRVGTHPRLRNGWAVREQTLRLAKLLPTPPPVPSATNGIIVGMSAQLERTVARGQHLDVIGILQPALLEAPWYADGYRCLAAAQCGSGQLAEARRTLRFYRMAADSAGRARAQAALQLLAAADTIGATELLKRQPRKPETEPGE